MFSVPLKMVRLVSVLKNAGASTGASAGASTGEPEPERGRRGSWAAGPARVRLGALREDVCCTRVRELSGPGAPCSCLGCHAEESGILPVLGLKTVF